MKLEIEVLQGNVFALQQFAIANDNEVLKSQIENMLDTKIKTAMAMVARPSFNGEPSYYKPLLESKAIQQIPSLSDAEGYRSWSRKMENAMEQVSMKSRALLELVEKLADEEIHNKYTAGGCTTKRDAIVMML